jgi:hypothetical protein
MFVNTAYKLEKCKKSGLKLAHVTFATTLLSYPIDLSRKEYGQPSKV